MSENIPVDRNLEDRIYHIFIAMISQHIEPDRHKEFYQKYSDNNNCVNVELKIFGEEFNIREFLQRYEDYFHECVKKAAVQIVREQLDINLDNITNLFKDVEIKVRDHFNLWEED